MSNHSPFAEPRWFSVNGRPVLTRPTDDGGLDILAFDWTTGEMTRNLDYLTSVVLPGTDTDELTHNEFDALVAGLRADIATNE